MTVHFSPGYLVKEFHATYGQPVRTIPTAVVPEQFMRRELIKEEAGEFEEASLNDDIVEMADALADIVYVAYGAAITHGIDLDAVLAEVHRSNMSKLGPDGKPILRDDGKVLKGQDYFKPDIAGVLAGGSGTVHNHDAKGYYGNCPACGTMIRS